ncbi:MAG: hypothetical protein ACKPKO_15010, partial [Candidatus Fonsibacter sp.]
MDDGDRVSRAVASLVRVASPKVPEPDIVTAAKKAAHVAAMEHSLNHTKTYEKLNVPPFPRSGEMSTWIYYLG